MLDFTKVNKKEMTMADLCRDLTRDDLRRLTNEMVDTMMALIADCTDADVTFEPDDPEAVDHAAATEAEVNMSWTLGHVIVHTTASAEEAAFLAAEMARGVEREGRSRYEVPWQRVTTIAQCRDRLEESRRMRLATLDVWPATPNLTISREYRWLKGPINGTARFVMGLHHDSSHLEQIEDIVAQAAVARQKK